MAKLAGVWIGAVVLVPMAIWLFGGTGRLASMKATLVWLDSGLFLFLAAANILRDSLIQNEMENMRRPRMGDLSQDRNRSRIPGGSYMMIKRKHGPWRQIKIAMEPAPRNVQEAKRQPGTIGR